MIRGIEKRRIVDDIKDRQAFVKRLGDLAERTETKVYAWSLLSNHAHLLLRSGALGLPKFMRRFLTGYAVTYNLRHLRHVWAIIEREPKVIGVVPYKWR
jgi:REP element-mobilizing transposase RayT